MASKFYTGTGCHVHNDCLTCPLERCIYDRDRTPRGSYTHLVTEDRRKKVMELRQSGFIHRDIAAHLGVSIRTVIRLSHS